MLARGALGGLFGARLIAALALASSPPVSASEPPAEHNRPAQHIGQRAATCGQGGLPSCPLQAFMRASVAAPLARGDMKTIAASLEKVATHGPVDWKTWSEFARQGAAAAVKNDRTAIRAACNDCHNAWRAEYRARYRERPL